MSQAGATEISSHGGSDVIQIDADTGYAIPLAGIINLFGGTNIFTSATGDTVTINSSVPSSIQTIDGDSGSITGTTITISGGSTGLTTSGSSSTMDLTGTLNVSHGGLGITTTPSNGQIPIGNGTDYTASTLTAGTGISISNSSGSVTIANSSPLSGLTIDADSGSMTGSTMKISGGSTGLMTSASSATMNLTGTLAVANGGSGATSLTGLLLGNGSSPFNATTYSQGTFTPGFAFGGATTGITYGAQKGFYVQIGNFIIFSAAVQLTSKGTATGNVTVTGFPVAGSSNSAYNFVVCFINNASSFPTGCYNAIIEFQTSETYATLTGFGPATSGTQNFTNSNFGNSTDIYVSGSYYVG